MDDFHRLTGMVTAVLDMDGNVIEATGWQDICTKFHRIHPETAKKCTESDLYLVKNMMPGEYLEYRCKNGLWDVVTPLYIGNEHLGNIYTGQFFYDDDVVDESRFIQQAETYGFDKDAYLAAFRRIPIYSRETIKHLMRFFVKFTSYISNVSYTNMKLEMEIHDRKQAEEALQGSEGRLRSLINALPDLVWLKDCNGVYLACNARFEKFFGAKEKEIIGKSDYHFMSKDWADFFRSYDKKALDKGGPNVNEEEIIFADDGHREILETIKTPIYTLDGRILGVLGIGRDITERKKAKEEENIKLLGLLQQSQKLESIGNLAGGIAHDFNNILFPIMGLSELLVEDSSPGSFEHENARQILKAAERGSDLVQQILAFSRQTDHKMMPIRIQNVLREVLKLARSTIPANIDIKHQIQMDCGLVNGDGTQVHQIAMNLITNAFHALEDADGEINVQLKEVRLENEDVADLLIQPGPYAMLTVTDTGCGMEPFILKKIFEPYFTTKEQGKGTGLGLAVVYGIVRDHKGGIKVLSEPNEGTTFTVYLPLIEKSNEKISIEKSLTYETGNEHILLVDDEIPILVV